MLKPVSMDSKTSCVSPYDSAINMEASDWDEYRKGWRKNIGAWRDHIKPKDGETITEFVIGVVPAEDLTRIADDCSKDGSIARPDELRWRCFLQGVRAINGWPGDPPPTKEIQGLTYVDPVWLRKTFVGQLRKAALTIGMSVWAFNEITEDEVTF